MSTSISEWNKISNITFLHFVGGMVGLFTGMSVLSLAEIGYESMKLLSNLVLHLCASCRVKRQS